MDWMEMEGTGGGGVGAGRGGVGRRGSGAGGCGEWGGELWTAGGGMGGGTGDTRGWARTEAIGGGELTAAKLSGDGDLVLLGDGVEALEGRAGDGTESGNGRMGTSGAGGTGTGAMGGRGGDRILVEVDMAGSRLLGIGTASLGSAKSCTSLFFIKSRASLLARLAVSILDVAAPFSSLRLVVDLLLDRVRASPAMEMTVKFKSSSVICEFNPKRKTLTG